MEEKIRYPCGVGEAHSMSYNYIGSPAWNLRRNCGVSPQLEPRCPLRTEATWEQCNTRLKVFSLPHLFALGRNYLIQGQKATSRAGYGAFQFLSTTSAKIALPDVRMFNDAVPGRRPIVSS